MPVIYVALQDGFQNDSVIIRLDGSEVYHKAGLETRMQIGLADSFDLEADAGTAELTIELPKRNIFKTVTLAVPADGEVYVGISITSDGTIDCRVTNEPFRYA